MPPLLEAAARERSPEETGVRLGALEGLTVLASHLGPEKMQADPRALDVLLECSRASDELVTPEAGQSPDFKPQGEVRGTAAFALGVIGGDRAKERLVLMLDDPYASARYNAATGLARQGDARTIPVLLEMLDPDNDLAANDKQNEADRENRRINVLKNGIEAASQLATKVSAAEREKIVAAVRKIDEGGCPKIKSEGGRTALRDRAREALQKIAKNA